MIRGYVLFLVLASSALAVVSLFRKLPLAVIVLFPLSTGLLCLGLGGAIAWAALSVPTDREAGLLLAGSVLLVAALNLGAAIVAIIRRR
ncbi:MAG: hypothetical protein K2X62_02455 [Beijerinckiaceae bacterium]|nr:hypothetical protein [Beijerinckiaceae bacterium]MBX9757767.1 hypothetical protein [Beijerinckiaceae bacterium]